MASKRQITLGQEVWNKLWEEGNMLIVILYMCIVELTQYTKHNSVNQNDQLPTKVTRNTLEKHIKLKSSAFY